MDMWFDNSDICWCADSNKCTNKKCFRHLDNYDIAKFGRIYTCSHLIGTEICPLGKEAE